MGPWWYKGGDRECGKVNLFRRKRDKRCPDEPRRTGIVNTCPPPGPVWEVNGKLQAFQYVEMKIRPKTWECGVLHPHSEFEIKKAYLYPRYH